ncbi:MAG: hypothetical protein R2882_12015 [Gemmatimonadales bacterium]
MTAGLPPTQEARGRPVEGNDPQAPTGYVTGIADGNLATPVRLRDYLQGVGVVFRLPKRDRKQEAREAAAEEAKKFRIRIPVRQIMMVLAPVAIAAVGYYAWDTFLSSVPLPSEVVGTWSTEDGRYAGRNFWINQNAVAFQNGEKSDQFSVHPIKRVKTQQTGDTLKVSVNYEQDGSQITLSFAYRESPLPEVRLTNQPSVRWVRTGKAPVIQ